MNVALHNYAVEGFNMNTEGFDQFLKMGKNMTGPFGDLQKASTEIFRRIAQQNLEMMGENFSRLSDQVRRLSDVRKPEDFFNLQKQCINEDVTATIENLQKMVHTSMENIEEFTKLCGSMTQETGANTMKAAEKFEKDREKEKDKHHK